MFYQTREVFFSIIKLFYFLGPWKVGSSRPSQSCIGICQGQRRLNFGYVTKKKNFFFNLKKMFFSLNYFFSATPSSLDNYYTIIEDPSQKLALLVDFVKKAQKCIVFFSTCACVEYFSVCLERLLKDRKIFSIHGKKGQKRHKVFDAFKQTKQGLLLCTGKT